MKTIDFEIKTGVENMQIDSDLLDFAIENNLKEPIFRLYGWSPACVSLGRNQSDEFLDKEFLKSKNIDVVRRLTGGRALLHDKELTYSFITPVDYLKEGQSVTGSYKEISQILINAFEKLGIKLEFGEKKRTSPSADNAQKHPNQRHPNYCMKLSTGADLCFQGKKLIGSAQLRKHGYILQHGSILFDYDKELVEKIFNQKLEGSNTDEDSLTCIKLINPALTFEDIKKLFE